MTKLEARRRRISMIRRRVAAIALTLFIATSAWILIELAVSQARTPAVARATSPSSAGTSSSGTSGSSTQSSASQSSSGSVSPVQTNAS